MNMHERNTKMTGSNQIEQADITNVRTHEHGIDPAKMKATGYMMFFCACISFSAWISMFDLGYGGIVLIMPSYNKAFGRCGMAPSPETGQTTFMCQLSATQQSLISVGSLFQALGSALAGVTSNYFGRRGTIQFASVLLVVGAAGMLGTSSSFLNYMVCKCTSGVGIGQLLASSVIYGTECCAASK